MPSPTFIHLRVHSSYSLLEGAITPKDLVKLAKKNKMPAVAVTDSGNLFSSLEFSLAAKDEGIQPIIGILLSVDSGERTNQGLPVLDLLPLLAKDEKGYYNLLQLSSKAFLETEPGITPNVSWETLVAHHEGLIALSGGTQGSIGRLLVANQHPQAENALKKLHGLFKDCFYIELMRHGMPNERAIEEALITFAYAHDVPLVATNDVYFVDEDMYDAHDALMCIAAGRYVTEQDRPRLTDQHYFKSPQEMEQLFADIPEAIANTVVIAKRCAVMSPTRKPILPHFDTEGGRSEEEELRAVAAEGLAFRLEREVFPILNIHPVAKDDEGETLSEIDARAKAEQVYKDRLQFELDVIIKMGFSGYFLIVSDFIRWSKRHDIPVGPGRGSGAGSVVAWALLITDLDPIRFGLLFERFLNPERVSMPDFDVDFCQERRDEVIRYVQEKYGQDHVAQIITFGKLQARAVLRDVGRVLQMPYGQVDRICKLVPNNPAQPVTLAEAIEIEPDLRRERDDDNDVKLLLQIGLQLEGLNRHASTHAAGVVIGDRPLSQLVPLYRDPRSNMAVTQYSMKYAEAAGLVKFDFLGLKTLTVIKQAVDLIRNTRNVPLDIALIPLDDPKTYKMLGEGDAVGVFQLESAGMRDTLFKMKPDRLEELIALISLYRPGPMDNIPTYIACKHGEQAPDYLHPKLTEILNETFGVIIYQEQVMQIAQVLSGYSLGGADLLRRAMGKKIKEEMDQQRKLFVDGAVDNSVDKAQAEGIFDLVAKFAGYGFNKSHAAAYALISYQTAYLKANYPVEFLVASMNLDIHDTDKLAVFAHEAHSHDIRLLPPDINSSEAMFSVEKLEDGTLGIRYALGALKGVGSAAMEGAVNERKAHGPYKDLFDLASRCDQKTINKRQIESLAKAGAFDSIHNNRRQALEGAEILGRYCATVSRERASAQVSLFGDAGGMEVSVPALPITSDWEGAEKSHTEREAIGFYLTSHPMAGYEGVIKGLGITRASDLADKAETVSSVKLAGVVTGKRIKNSARGKYAFVQFSDVTGPFEVSIFNDDLLSSVRDALDDTAPLYIHAEIRKDDTGNVRLIAESIRLLSVAMGGQVFRYRITLNEAAYNAAVLKQALGEPGKGNAEVTVEVETQDYGKVMLTLPSRYAVTPISIPSLESLEGVVSVVSV
ncbi:MAG: dnaE1 [Rickettsiales bacterium]|jgi:DNA polymerase-3 subunit alpha|nr:dnaE1 [Rickettsiales bacterium]